MTVDVLPHFPRHHRQVQPPSVVILHRKDDLGALGPPD